MSQSPDAPHLERLGVPVLDEILSVVPRAHHWRKGKNGPYFAKDRDTGARLPLTMQVIKEALHGGLDPFGVALLEPGSTAVRFAVLDMDAHAKAKDAPPVVWPEMQAHAKRLIGAGEKVGVRFIPFRSTGGSGIHLYAFWSEPQDARSVRALLGDVLHSCGFKNGTKGVVADEIEVFPKQDAVGEESLGNMVVPAFFRKARALKRSTLAEIPAGGQKVLYSDPVPSAPPDERPVAPPVPAGDADFARVRSALMHLDPNEFDYDQWIRLVMAVSHGTGGSEAGRALIHEWSSRFSRYSAAETDKQWNWATPDKARGITVNTLFAAARERGWFEPPNADGFHDLSVEGLEREARGFEYVVDVRYDFAENVALCVEEEADQRRIISAIKDDETRAFVAEGVAAVEARSAVEKVRANKAPPLPSAVQLIAQLQSEPRDNIVATWAARAAHLARSEVEDVIDAVERITRIGKRKLAGALNEARANLAKQRAKKEFERVQAGRERIEVEAGEVGTMSQRAESAVVARVPSGGFLSFSGAPVKVEVDTLPCTHLIDDQDVAPPPVLQLKPFNESSMRTTIEENAIFMSRDARGHERREDVPANVIKNVLVNPSPRVPRVTGLISHPVVLPNGEIVAVDGLHAKTGLFLHGAAMGGLRPYTQAEAAAALARLRVVLFGEFEFASELDGDIAIAGLFTGFGRRLMPSAPGLAVLASRQSSGKTTLARMIHVALTGHDMPVTTLSESSEELKKHLLAMLVRAPEMVCIDNIGDGMTFRSATLASIMTSSSYRDRRLGVSEEVDVRTETLWVITGNNLQLGADEITRWMVCRLEPKTSRPEEREFRNGDVVGAVRRARVQIIRDIVGIVAGYLASGASVGDGKSTRFKEWDRLVRLPIIWAGGADVTEVFRQNREQSPDEMAKVGVLSAIRDLVGDDEFYPTDVVSWLTGTAPRVGAGMPSAAQDDAMSRLRTSMSEQRIKDIRSTKSVGRALAGMANTTVEADGVFLTLRSRIKDGTRRYQVEVK